MAEKLILCDCAGSQKLDAEALEAATGVRCSKVYTALCTDQAEIAAKAIAEGGCTIVCGQEMRFFEDLAEDLDAEVPGFLDLRDRAGWTEDTRDTGPKMAALCRKRV